MKNYSVDVVSIFVGCINFLFWAHFPTQFSQSDHTASRNLLTLMRSSRNLIQIALITHLADFTLNLIHYTLNEGEEQKKAIISTYSGYVLYDS